MRLTTRLTSRSLLFAALTVVMTVYGFSVTMIGPLMPSLIGEYTLRLSGGGLFATARSIGGVVAAVAGGALSDRLPKGRLVVLCFAGYGLSLMLVGFAPAYVLLLLLFFVMGGATRPLDSVSNALTADLFPDGAGPALNILHTVFAVGALIGPIFSRLMLLGSGRWQQAYTVLAAICLAVLFIFVVTEKKLRGAVSTGSSGQWSVAVDDDTAAASTLGLLRYPHMWLVSGIMFCYAGHQSGASVWLPTFVQATMGSSITVSAGMVSLLWIGIIAGRLVVVHLSRRYAARTLLAGGAFLAGGVLALGFLMATPRGIGVACLLAGFFTGAVVPLLVAVACAWRPQNTGSASALIFLNASLSRMLFPWLIGLTAQTLGFQAGMSLTWVPLIVAGALALFMPKDAGVAQAT